VQAAAARGACPTDGCAHGGAPVSAAGELTTLYIFGRQNGAYPDGPIVQDAGGDFYGTTVRGGDNDDGTAYRMTPDGHRTVLLENHS
jgi:uncharacterized repeat protein (TIGR03803 family)